MKKFISAFLLMTLAVAGFGLPMASAADKYVEGVDYSRVVPAQPTSTDGKVEVVELFWYGCPHCYQLEPYLKRWLQTKPDHIEYVRMPAIFSNDNWRPQAAAFYTADVLGVLDRFHDDIFHAMQEQNRRLRNEDALAEFFAERGVDDETFRKTYRSFAVQTRVGRAKEMTKRYGIDGVPAMIVAGRYRVSGSQAKTFDRMLDIVEFLAAREARGADKVGSGR